MSLNSFEPLEILLKPYYYLLSLSLAYNKDNYEKDPNSPSELHIKNSIHYVFQKLVYGLQLKDQEITNLYTIIGRSRELPRNNRDEGI